jgi:signal transduction histidine kinase
MLQLLRNMKVSTKLITVLAAPVIVLIVLATLGFTERTSDADEARRVERLTEFIQVNSALIGNLQREAVRSTADMAVVDATLQRDAAFGDAYRGQLELQRSATDDAVAAFEASVDRIDPGRGSATVAEALLNGQTRLSRLSTVRTSVDSRIQTSTQITDEYHNITSSLIAINASLVQTTGDPDLLLGLTTVANVERVKNARASEGALLTQAAVRNEFSNREGGRCEVVSTEDCTSYLAAVGATNQVGQAEENFDRFASASEKQTLRAVSTKLTLDELRRQVFDQAQNGNFVTVDQSEVIAASFDALAQLESVETQFVGSVNQQASALAADAESAARLYLTLTLLAVVAALGIALLVARATAVPLRKLTSAAYSLSTDKLPGLVERLRNPEDADEPLSASLTPIDIDSKDEVGQLADAFNSIQQVTIEVAEEQAQLLRKGIGDIFINLARRNQTLLDRQIEFIDQLEANEEDPDQLDNLFKLDHLATRMRRNAESLLVLAGAEPPRRRGRPVALADVVRVAIGEVEDFARIQLLALDEATVAGNVAVDLAHLLSELMENATHFSPPDTTVEIVGQSSEGGTYVLSVSDQGIGMSADQLAEANAQLSRPPLVGLAMSRSLGFIVIGRLASRFDISVKLTASPSGGVTALATLPAALVTHPGEDTPPTPPMEQSAVTDTLERPFAAPAVDEPVLDESAFGQPLAAEPALADTPFDETGFDLALFDTTGAEAATSPPAELPVDDAVGGAAPDEGFLAPLERRRPTEPVAEEPPFDEPRGDEGEPSVLDEPMFVDERDTMGSPESTVPTGPGRGSRHDLLDELVEEVVPDGDDFERGLQSLVDDALAPGPVEPSTREPASPPADDDAGSLGPPATLDEALPPVDDVAPLAARESRPADGAAPMQRRVPQATARETEVRARPVAGAPADADMTPAGLVKRTPKKRSASAVGGGMPTMGPTRQTGQSQRSPEEVRKMLSRYRSGLNKGRGGADPDGRT